MNKRQNTVHYETTECLEGEIKSSVLNIERSSRKKCTQYLAGDQLLIHLLLGKRMYQEIGLFEIVTCRCVKYLHENNSFFEELFPELKNHK